MMTKRRFLKTALLGAGGISCFGNFALSNESSDHIKGFPAKWTKEALFYEKTPRGVQCQICPNECNIREGETGDCRNRINHNGILYTIAYGDPCVVNVDPVEKKPLLHFLPESKCFSIATAGCNLACLNCQNWTISQKSPMETENIDLPPEKVVSSCIQSGCLSVAYTYSEPITYYEYTYDTSVIAHQQGIRNILVSAGYINPEPLRKLCKVIDAANIDLKSFSNEIYLKLNGGKLHPVLNTLKTLKDEGVWLEITNLVIPSWNDDPDMVKRMCNWLYENGFEDTPLHFSRFFPMYKLLQLPPTPVNVLKNAREIAIKEGLKYVYVGNVPELDMENTICPKCHKVVIKRRGYRIMENHIKDGKCEFCGGEIAGVWK